MTLLLRYSIIILTLFASFVVATDSADARRRFRFGGGSRTVVVPTVRSHSGEAQGAQSGSTDTGSAITLVHTMPDTSDYAYANGYYDIGFRDTPDGQGEYVIYAGSFASPLKPELQKGIADMLGFDPVERHKTSRKAGMAASQSRQSVGTVSASRQMPWASILIVLALVGFSLLFLWKRLTSQAAEVGVGAPMPDMESRIETRLRQLRP